MKTKHTPTPWTVQKPSGHQHAIDRRVEIVAKHPEGGETVIVGEHTGIDCLGRTNAQFIVQAVNHHAELVEALKDLEAISSLVSGLMTLHGQVSSEKWYSLAIETENARSLLTKLKG